MVPKEFCFQQMQLKRSEGFGQGTRRVCVAEWLALPTLDHEVLKLNPTGGIKKTYLYNSDPLNPHIYTVKLGFTGVYIIFLISAQNIDCGYSLELPRRGGSNEYPQSMF